MKCDLHFSEREALPGRQSPNRSKCIRPIGLRYPGTVYTVALAGRGISLPRARGDFVSSVVGVACVERGRRADHEPAWAELRPSGL